MKNLSREIVQIEWNFSLIEGRPQKDQNKERARWKQLQLTKSN